MMFCWFIFLLDVINMFIFVLVDWYVIGYTSEHQLFQPLYKQSSLKSFCSILVYFLFFCFLVCLLSYERRCPGRSKHRGSSPPLDNLLHAPVWPQRTAPYSPNVCFTALQDIPPTRDLLSRTSKGQTRLRVPRGAYQHPGFGPSTAAGNFLIHPRCDIPLPPQSLPFLRVLASNKFDLAWLLLMASYSLPHNSSAQVRTEWMTVRLRLKNLPTFPGLREARWSEWGLVLAASKLFRRSACPPPSSRSMCPGRWTKYKQVFNENIRQKIRSDRIRKDPSKRGPHTWLYGCPSLKY